MSTYGLYVLADYNWRGWGRAQVYGIAKEKLPFSDPQTNDEWDANCKFAIMRIERDCPRDHTYRFRTVYGNPALPSSSVMMQAHRRAGESLEIEPWNHYHNEDRVEKAKAALVRNLSISLDKRNVFMHVYDQGCRGMLTEAEFNRVSHSFDSYFLRDLYTSGCSWSAYTVEFQESLVKLINAITKGPPVPNIVKPAVLEVCAGQGMLAKSMNERGILWMATDRAPQHGTMVEQMDALDSLKEYHAADILLASWINYESELDCELYEEWVVKRRKPMILIGEGPYGCTGSKKFWSTVGHGEDATDFVPDFRDVPQFSGFHDYTQVFLPKFPSHVH